MISTGKASMAWRTLVQARHIFSFVTIGELGWKGPWRSVVNETMDSLLTHARRTDGFFVHSLNEDASVHDGRADLYDQAFVLLALAVAGAAIGGELFEEAEALFDRVDEQWRHPRGGFREGEIADPRIRRQNPHMHLLESLIELFVRSGRERFKNAAFTLAELAVSRFIDGATGALIEYFDDALSPAPGQRGLISEPGHCFEWAWLFERLAQLGWEKGVAVSDRLTAFARSRGLDARRGVAINEILISGEIINDSARLWPQTERLKAAVARFERTGNLEEAGEVTAGTKSLDIYLDVRLSGAWRDKLRPDGSWVAEPAPGSSFYHLTCAYAELIGAAQLKHVDGATAKDRRLA